MGAWGLGLGRLAEHNAGLPRGGDREGRQDGWTRQGLSQLGSSSNASVSWWGTWGSTLCIGGHPTFLHLCSCQTQPWEQ